MVGSLGLGASGSVMICGDDTCSKLQSIHQIMYGVVMCMHVNWKHRSVPPRAYVQRHAWTHQPRTAIAIPACRGRCGGRRCGRAAARRWRTAWGGSRCWCPWGHRRRSWRWRARTGPPPRRSPAPPPADPRTAPSPPYVRTDGRRRSIHETTTTTTSIWLELTQLALDVLLCTYICVWDRSTTYCE